MRCLFRRLTAHQARSLRARRLTLHPTYSFLQRFPGRFGRSQAVVEQCRHEHDKVTTVIDCDGFRPNVGIVLCNRERRVFWGKRIGQNAWQFPQGGIQQGETPDQALYRELAEETGLLPRDVRLLGATTRWYRYRLPAHFVRRDQRPLCIGQKQRWYLLELLAGDEAVRLDANATPEFDEWRWIEYWRPTREVVYFKREVYRRALRELAPLMFPDAVEALARHRQSRDQACAGEGVSNAGTQSAVSQDAETQAAGTQAGGTRGTGTQVTIQDAGRGDESSRY